MLVNKFKILLLISISFLTSTHASSMKLDLDETPLGAYTKRVLPTVEGLPEKCMLRMTPVKNQNPLGTCVSFAVSACGEFFYKSLGLRFSEAEFTILAETHLPRKFGGNCKPGINLGEALKLGQIYGLSTESKLSYAKYLTYVAHKNGIRRNFDWINKTPSICTRLNNPINSYNTTMREMGSNLQMSGTQDDIGYRLPNLYPIHHVSRSSLFRTLRGQVVEEACIGKACNADTEWTKNALALGYPVAVALPIFGKKIKEGIIYTNWDDNRLLYSGTNFPTVRNPNLTKHQIVGHHAVVLTGFDDKSQTFRVKNSWGNEWGDQGEADIPYDYIKLYATELVAVGK